MATVHTGQRAESAAANYLAHHGCQIIERNWRTKLCEIDIIAKRGDVAYFCEVKYRRSNLQGSGLDYITPKKLQQMRFAAELWVQWNSWPGDYQLCAIEVSGPAFQITNVVKDL